MKWFADFLDLVFPRPCEACGDVLLKQEHLICTSCLIDLPRINLREHSSDLAKKFWGKLPVTNAYSFLEYAKKGKVQHLLHQLKYRNKPELGIYLGELFGEELNKINFCEQIDLLVAIPLHKEKEKQRGYNQANCIAEGLSKTLNLPFDKAILQRTKFTETQTKKNRMERFQNVENIFEITDSEKISGKRIAIIDDVLTTGSTLESCGITLLENGCKEVVMLTIARVK